MTDSSYSPAVLENLYAALDVEARLMAGLVDMLARQRAAVAADHTEMVDVVTHEMTRALLTLEEVAKRRIALVEAISGDRAGRLGEVERVLGPVPKLVAARSLLRTLGAQVSRDLSVSQMVLKRALRSGDAYLQNLLTTTAGPRPGYTQAREVSVMPERGILLNMSA